MTCPDAQPWLLAARSDADLPPEVRDHRSTCPVCATQWVRLMAVDAGARALGEADDAPALRRFDAALERTPQPASDGGGRRVRRVGFALLAGVLVATGWVGGRLTAPPGPVGEIAPVEPAATPEPAAPPAAGPSPTAPLLVRLAEPAGRLVQEPTTAGRTTLLREMAEQVREEAERLAAAGQTTELPRLAAAYDRLVRYGLVDLAHQLAATDRAAVEPRLVADLDRAAAEMESAAESAPPAVADLLGPLVRTARDTADAIRRHRPPAPRPATADNGPIDALAALAVRAAAADDSLSRAEVSVELAGVLARGTVLLAVGGKPAAAAQLGPVLDDLWSHGVADNLDRTEAADPGGTRQAEVARIRARAADTAGVLERNLARAPPAARPGLERALAASRHGRERAAQGGRGKGPPWKRPDGAKLPPGQSGVPPGWQKKK